MAGMNRDVWFDCRRVSGRLRLTTVNTVDVTHVREHELVRRLAHQTLLFLLVGMSGRSANSTVNADCPPARVAFQLQLEVVTCGPAGKGSFNQVRCLPRRHIVHNILAVLCGICGWLCCSIPNIRA